MEIDLNPKQGLAFNSVANELLFGGAAGPGKSYALRVSGIRWCLEVPGIQVYLFRRTLRDLRDNHLRGPANLFTMLADHTKTGQVKYRAVENEFEFWNGSRLHLCYCDSENDVENYRGAEIHVLLPDELTHFSDFQYRFLRGRVRKAGLDIPLKYAGDLDYLARKSEAIEKKDSALLEKVTQFEADAIARLNVDRNSENPFPKLPRIEAASNPGSIGHAWVKRTWIAPNAPMTLWKSSSSEGGMIREYIPGKLADNPHLMRDDPDYADRLRGSGSADLVRAILDGDWDIVAGQAFEKLRRDTHCIPAFPNNQPPRDWLVCGSFDWGSSKPFSFGLWAVSNGNPLPHDFGENAGRVLPRGAIVRFNEWYGWNGKPNEGLRLEVSEVARGIKQKCTGLKVAYIAADPSCWKVDGGPSHAELMLREGVVLRRADNSRHSGYQAVRSRIAGDEEDGPMLYATANCHAGFWRTMPDLVMDEHDSEDVDTDQEDHCFIADTMVTTYNGRQRLGDLVGTEGVILNGRGKWVAYHSCRLTRRHADTVTLLFDDGFTVQCTPDHRFMLEDGRWCEARNLRGKSVLSWKAKQRRHSWVKRIGFAGFITSGMASGFTAKCGDKISVKFQKVATCITTTATKATITLKTLFSCTAQNIYPCMVMSLSASNTQRCTLSEFGKRRQNGTAARKVSSGTEAITKSTAKTHYSQSLTQYAQTVESHSKQQSEKIQCGFVQTTAAQQIEGSLKKISSIKNACNAATNTLLISILQIKHALLNALGIGVEKGRVKCLDVKKSENADVYCLTVPSSGSFCLGNGIVTHNCFDDVRYMAMSRPWMKTKDEPKKRVDRWLARLDDDDNEDSWRTA